VANIARLYRGEDPEFAAENDAEHPGPEPSLKATFPRLRYADVAGLCKVATLKEIEAQGWSLNPGRREGVTLFGHQPHGIPLELLTMPRRRRHAFRLHILLCSAHRSDLLWRALSAPRRCPKVLGCRIVALSRFGGLRCPSEVLSLRWQDVDWEAGRIVVQSPKTEHHVGKASRTIPLFAELRPILAEAFDLAPEGAVYVVDGNHRDSANTASGWRNCNLRTQFERIVKRAGLLPWPRLFHAMRASRETELAKEYPIHAVTAWLGNTPRIALKHYLQVTDVDFQRAAEGLVGSGAESGARSAQNAAQQAHAENCTDSQVSSANPAECVTFATSCESQLLAEKELSGEDRIRTCGPVTRSRI